MANKKYHYYVLVFAEIGPVYVTSINHTNKYAHWDKDKEPLEMGAYLAEDLAMGLNCNFINAVVIKSQIEIKEHPYNYEYFDIKFIRKEKEEK